MGSSFKATKPVFSFLCLQATMASVCIYGGLQVAGNRDYCAVATQGVSKRNPCWPGWRPVGGRGQCVYTCDRMRETSMAQTDASGYYIIIIMILCNSESFSLLMSVWLLLCHV